MKTLNHFALVATGALLSGMMNTTAAFAETEGTIQFSGALIEDVCTVNQQQSNVYASCRATDGTIQTAQYKVSTSASGFLPADKGTTHVKWMNDNHTVGVVTAMYH